MWELLRKSINGIINKVKIIKKYLFLFYYLILKIFKMLLLKFWMKIS